METIDIDLDVTEKANLLQALVAGLLANAKKAGVLEAARHPLGETAWKSAEAQGQTVMSVVEILVGGLDMAYPQGEAGFSKNDVLLVRQLLKDRKSSADKALEQIYKRADLDESGEHAAFVEGLVETLDALIDKFTFDGVGDEEEKIEQRLDEAIKNQQVVQPD